MEIEIHDDFDLARIAGSGQCFRWTPCGDGWRILSGADCLHIAPLGAGRCAVDCGEADFAEDAARRYYNGVAAIYEKTGTIWENSSPEQCENQKTWAGGDFCGWGALAPVALPVEFGWL